MAQVKKLSVATVYGKIALSKLMEAPNRTLSIMKVIGVAVGIDTGLSSFGEWKALKGRFQATDSKSGEIHQAATLFLPDVALTPIEVALSQNGARGVEFGIEIFAKYVAEDEGHKAGGSPYEYTWEPLLAMSAEDDPLLKIAAKIAAQQKALEAPKVDETPAPTPAPAAKKAK